jgi:hypothetical protein
LAKHTEKKDTRTEHEDKIICDELIEYVATRMAAGVAKFELKRELEREINDGHKIEIFTYERIRRAAREYLRSRAKVSRDDKVAELLQFYESMRSNDKVASSVRLRAAAQLEELLGLGAKFEGSAQDMSPIREALKELDKDL